LRLLLALLCAFPADAQRAENAATQCFALSNHVEQRDCLTGLELKTDTERQAAERALEAAIRTSGEEPVLIRRTLDALAVATQKYLAYRAAQCDAIAALALGGNGAGDRQALCHIELDTRRVADLRAARP
jgi:uncharacterized protein YecT (DUF1311 family)